MQFIEQYNLDPCMRTDRFGRDAIASGERIAALGTSVFGIAASECSLRFTVR